MIPKSKGPPQKLKTYILQDHVTMNYEIAVEPLVLWNP